MILAFCVTWVLHSYQMFWIEGHFPIAWNDVLFWGILAVLVVANALHEWRRGRRRRLPGRQLSWGETVRTAGATVGVFCVIAILWSLWSTDSVATWLSLWPAISTPPGPGQGWIVALLVAVPSAIALSVVASFLGWLEVRRVTPLPQAAHVAVVTTCLMLASWSPVYRHLGASGTLISLRPSAGADSTMLMRPTSNVDITKT